MKSVPGPCEVSIVTGMLAVLGILASSSYDKAEKQANYSQLQTNFQELATGIAAYEVDNSAFPSMESNTLSNMADPEALKTLLVLTTPIAYIADLDSASDPFLETDDLITVGPGLPGAGITYNSKSLQYMNYQEMNRFYTNTNYDGWALVSHGPDRVEQQMEWVVYNYAEGNLVTYADVINATYDPTNGTNSSGDVLFQFGEPVISAPSVLTDWQSY